MTRRDELLELIGRERNEGKARQLVDEVVFLEERMQELRALPFLRIDPKDPSRQKATPAGKMYKECLAQYNSSLRLLLRLAGDLSDGPDDSPLRLWLRSRAEDTHDDLDS